MIAVVLSLPTRIDLWHAAEIYGAIVGCAVTLWIIAAVVGTVADWVHAMRQERRAYAVRRMMEAERER